MIVIRGLWIIAGLLLIGAVFQLFLRYQYLHTAGLAVMRIDRVTGSSCYMPCVPFRTGTVPPILGPSKVDFHPNFFDENSPEAEALANEDAISLVKAMPDAREVIAGAKPDSKWSSVSANLGAGNPYSDSNRVRLVRYADADGNGFYWEVHLDTRRVYFVNDDDALSARYF
jgi:hypothetical protein